jgi:hypothetical protein
VRRSSDSTRLHTATSNYSSHRRSYTSSGSYPEHPRPPRATMSDFYPPRCPMAISRSYSVPPKYPMVVGSEVEHPRPPRRDSAPPRAPGYHEVPKTPAKVKSYSDPSSPPTSVMSLSSHPGTKRRLSEPFRKNPESYFVAVRIAASWGLPRAESEPHLSGHRFEKERGWIDEWPASLMNG